jgi:DNA-binding Lrp family transcriptional regulator
MRKHFKFLHSQVNMLTKKDRDILNVLQTNCKTPLKKIAKLTNLRTSTVHDHIKKLEKQGIIKEYVAIVDDKKLNLKTFWLFIKLKPSDFLIQEHKILMKNPHILEIINISGEYSIMMKLVFEHIEEFVKFNQEFRKKYAEYLDEIVPRYVLSHEKKDTKRPLSYT